MAQLSPLLNGAYDLYFIFVFLFAFYFIVFRTWLYIYIFFLPFLGYPFKDKGQHKCEEEKMEMSHN